VIKAPHLLCFPGRVEDGSVPRLPMQLFYFTQPKSFSPAAALWVGERARGGRGSHLGRAVVAKRLWKLARHDSVWNMPPFKFVPQGQRKTSPWILFWNTFSRVN